MSIVDDRNYHRCGKMMCHRLDCLDCYPTMAPIMRATDEKKNIDRLVTDDDFGSFTEETRKERQEKVSKDFAEYVDKLCPGAVVKVDALGTQVAGKHYTDMGIQPIEVCYKRHGYAGVKIALQVKVDKYLSRSKDDELEQLNKAIHCIELMKTFYEKENG